MFREANSQTKYFRWKLQLTVMCTKYIWTIWKNVVLECNIYIYNDTQSLIIFQKWYSPPPKRGYVFGRVCLCAYLFVCLSVIRISNKVKTGIASGPIAQPLWRRLIQSLTDCQIVSVFVYSSEKYIYFLTQSFSIKQLLLSPFCVSTAVFIIQISSYCCLSPLHGKTVGLLHVFIY